MTDIVERLRDGGETCGIQRCTTREAKGCTCAEAANEIERLREQLSTIRRFAMSGEMDTIVEVEIERLRGALRSLACAEGKCGCEVFGIKDVNVGCLHGIARAALEEGKE